MSKAHQLSADSWRVIGHLYDPIHLVMCALRTYADLTLFTLLRGLASPVGFGELCELADRHLFDTYLLGTDTEIPIRQMRDMPSFAYARQTAVGRAYAANQ